VRDASFLWRLAGVTSWGRFTSTEVLEAHQVAAPAFARWVRGFINC
jgi:hypothetical protein